MIQAPGLYQGYGSDVSILPLHSNNDNNIYQCIIPIAITQAIRDEDWTTANIYVEITATVIYNAAEFLGGTLPISSSIHNYKLRLI